MRRRSRIDANQPEITKAMRALGAVVTPIHALGHGIPDLLVSWRQTWFLVEVKDGSKPKSAQALTADEKKWIEAQRAPVYIVTSVKEAIDLLADYEFAGRSRGSASARALSVRPLR